jgi:pimeloyl-ACP methyl ester carboxylesterase
VPALIIHGTADVNVPVAHSENLAGRIGGAQLHIVEGADHMMPLTYREEVDKTIDEFLNNHGLTDFVE